MSTFIYETLIWNQLGVQLLLEGLLLTAKNILELRINTGPDILSTFENGDCSSEALSCATSLSEIHSGAFCSFLIISHYNSSTHFFLFNLSVKATTSYNKLTPTSELPQT